MRIQSGWLWSVVVPLCLAPCTFSQASMFLTGAGNNVMGGVYAGPYQATVNGVPTPVICDDFLDESYLDEAWTADMSTVASLGTNVKWGQSNQLRYDQAAWLAVEMFLPVNSNPATMAEISFAIWDIFDPGPSGAINYLASYPGVNPTYVSGAKNWVSMAQSQTFTSGEFSEVQVYSVDSSQPITCGGGKCPTAGPPQEFLVVATPEPPALAFLAVDLLSLLAVVLFVRRRALTAANHS